ncbi:hypothetical protein HYPSUDRAFT_205966 [Hypholoma sublateritium FD-334 SS-4]|uniref:Uncharacterized protein n=1 Tax=Hypholoma sublateritium (strain FD-334 SS-4) TaxID=945553 RepID=A0A0D2NFK2_HYPSF|nr:hypothetical protein HYPSUDRAFT_205966 [Hypholoma sublateritium FD-334 SS-4]
MSGTPICSAAPYVTSGSSYRAAGSGRRRPGVQTRPSRATKSPASPPIFRRYAFRPPPARSRSKTRSAGVRRPPARSDPPCARALSFSAERAPLSHRHQIPHDAFGLPDLRTPTPHAAAKTNIACVANLAGPAIPVMSHKKGASSPYSLIQPRCGRAHNGSQDPHRRAWARTDARRTLSASAVQSKPAWHMPGCSARSQRDRAALCRAYQSALPALRLSAYLHHEASSGDSAFAPQPPAQRAVTGRAHAGSRVLATRIASEVCIQPAWARPGRT